MGRLERISLRISLNWGAISGALGMKNHALEVLMELVRRKPDNHEVYRQIDRLLNDGRERLGISRYAVVPVNKFCLFIGHGRSGHSLIGSLLDAHPSIVMSHELNAIRCAEDSSYDDLYRYIRYNSFIFARKGRSWTGYDYQVENQFQGTLGGPIEILGDKKGGGTSKALSEDPYLLNRLMEIVPCPIVFLHVIRHPLDNIATNAIRSGHDLTEAVEWFFLRAKSTKWLASTVPADSILHIYLDDFISSPITILREILEFLGVSSISEEYLQSCSRMVNNKPSMTRDRVQWPDEVINDVIHRCSDYPYLSRYFN